MNILRETQKKVDLLWSATGFGIKDPVMIHRKSITTQNQNLVVKLLCRKLRGAEEMPTDLTLITVSTFNGPTILENCLDYIGLAQTDYVVLRPRIEKGDWRGTTKLKALHEYVVLQNSCKTKYVMYADSIDVIVVNHLYKAIDALLAYDAQMLFSTTHVDAAYECMPDRQAWARDTARSAGFDSAAIFLNAGVCIGETEAMKALLSHAASYTGPGDLTRKQYRDLRASGKLCGALPNFPHGVGSDQAIYRYLQPDYYPQLRLDYSEKLAVR